MMLKMQNRAFKILFLLIFISIKVFSQKIEEKSWHYVSLGIHPQYFFKPNDRILIFPLNYEFVPNVFNHHWGLGLSLNYNNVKINYQKEFSIGMRYTYYLLKNPKLRPYFGFGIYAGNLKWLDEWIWSKYGRPEWQARVFAGLRVKVAKNYMVFTEYGNYRIGSPKFNLGFGVTRTFYNLSPKQK